MPEAFKTVTAKGSQSNQEMVGLLDRRGEMLCSVRATLSSVASIRPPLRGQKNRAMIGKWGRPLVRLMAMKGWQAVVGIVLVGVLFSYTTPKASRHLRTCDAVRS
jgi:hypothetical protein